jgi:ABC-2 type transport system ATP-binding protein
VREIESEPAVRVQRLARHFGAEKAVDQISFDVGKGELFGLVGPDGAGKTTLLRMLAGVLRPTSGDATIFGVSVARDPERVKHDIAYMSQRFGLYTDLTVLENLLFYADLYQVPKREREERLERLFHFSSLEPFQHRLAGQLSGGMKQKLGLSCALIHEPRLLLLDEPTFGVDPISRRDLWLIVHEMVSSGVTAIVSTSYMDEAERFDRLGFLHRGQVIDIGSPDHLLHRIHGELLSIAAEPLRDARRLVLDRAEARSATIFGDRLHVLVESAERDGAAIQEALEAQGIEVASRNVIPPTLEDVFIDAIERGGTAE